MKIGESIFKHEFCNDQLVVTNLARHSSFQLYCVFGVHVTQFSQNLKNEQRQNQFKL